ncbi:MAG: THUMP domain-containing protein [Bacteroidota bacterium]
MELSSTGIAPQTFIVKTIAGLEQVLADEIVELGGDNVQVLTRAVSFEGDKRMLYKANYCLRTAQRILMPIFTFQMADEDDLYNQVTAYPWENYLTLQKTLAVDAVSSDSELTHTHYIAQRTKDAIVDRFRTISNGRRPSVDTENPHVRINIHIRGSICDVSVDSSGASLHKRGYRVSNAEAPMSEVLAAGLIMLSGWKHDCHFIDPMCGSGTLVIEAAMIANNFPAGMYRKEFGFMHWPDFDQDLWNEVTKEAMDKQTEFEFQILGSDISTKNLASARANVKSARLHKDITLSVNPFSAIQPPPGDPGIVIINPPYGERIRLVDIIGLYKSIGNTLKQEFAGYQAWVISSDQRALSMIGLRPTAKLPVFNGPLECRFEHFDLYKGSKRGRYMDGENTGEDGRDYSKKADKPDWRSKDAPEGEFDSLDPKRREFKTREFKPRSEYSERKSARFDSKEGGNDGNRPPRRERDSSESEYKSKEFKPREYKPREESGDTVFIPREKKEFNRDDRKSDRPARDDRYGKGDRPERRKVEKIKLKPATRIEERDEYLHPKKVTSEVDREYPENYEITPAPVQSPEAAPEREPSKGNKFTEQRDYKIARTRELRPRKPKPEEAKTLPEKVKPEPKTPKPPVNFDDLED